MSNSLEKFESSIDNSDNEKFVLTLYIAGMTPNSKKAVENIKRICDENLKGKYSLEIIDIYQQPQLAETNQILAAPTLIKLLPSPIRKLIGDMSNTEKVLLGLNVRKIE